MTDIINWVSGLKVLDILLAGLLILLVTEFLVQKKSKKPHIL